MKNIKVNVLICTKNSNKKIEKINILDECFKAIRREVPYNQIVIVDGFSNDGTVERAKSYFGKKLYVIRTSAKLGKAREIGLKLCKSNWVFIIDSDVILPKNTWKKILPLTTKYDAIECDYINYYPNGFISCSKRRQRGILLATLIKKECLDGIKIPEDMEVYEDEFIKRYVKLKCGSWYHSTIKVKHYPNLPTNEIGYKIGYYGGKYNLKPLWEVISGLILFHNLLYWNIFYGWLISKVEKFKRLFRHEK